MQSGEFDELRNLFSEFEELTKEQRKQNYLLIEEKAIATLVVGE